MAQGRDPGYGYGAFGCRGGAVARPAREGCLMAAHSRRDLVGVGGKSMTAPSDVEIGAEQETGKAVHFPGCLTGYAY